MRPLVCLLIVFAPGWLAAQIRPAPAPAPAGPDPLDELVRDSPFLPATGPAAPPSEGGPLELRGVLFEDGHFLFSVYDEGTKKSKWIRLGETDAPFVARSFDHENDILTVEYQGRSVALKLPPAHVAGVTQPGAPTPPAPLPTPQEASRPAQPPQPVAQPTAQPGIRPEESQRLQNMADEIRRRRLQQKK
jgi:hypothetical protein